MQHIETEVGFPMSIGEGDNNLGQMQVDARGEDVLEMSAHNNPTISEKNPTMEEVEQHHFKDMDLMEETNKEKGANVQGNIKMVDNMHDEVFKEAIF
jgi:hypothetical protein